MVSANASKELLLFTTDQYGYQTDYIAYERVLLEAGYQVTYLCLDQNLPRIKSGTNVVYVEKKSTKLLTLLEVLRHISSSNKNNGVLLTKYFLGASALLIRFQGTTLADLRTMAVNQSFLKRRILNMFARMEVLAAKHVLVVSQELADKHRVSNYSVVPLGGKFPKAALRKVRDFNKLKLLYVGTLEGRNLEQVVLGAVAFTRRSPELYVSIDFFGTNQSSELEKALEISRNYPNLHVRLLGFLENDKFDDLSGQYDFGIVHVPDEDRYRVQPSTKLFEYISIGLPVLSTNYAMTRWVETEGLGVTYESSGEGFENGLMRALAFEANFQAMFKFAVDHEWHGLLRKTLIPAIEGLNHSASP